MAGLSSGDAAPDFELTDQHINAWYKVSPKNTVPNAEKELA